MKRQHTSEEDQINQYKERSLPWTEKAANRHKLERVGDKFKVVVCFLLYGEKHTKNQILRQQERIQPS